MGPWRKSETSIMDEDGLDGISENVFAIAS